MKRAKYREFVKRFPWVQIPFYDFQVEGLQRRSSLCDRTIDRDLGYLHHAEKWAVKNIGHLAERSFEEDLDLNAASFSNSATLGEILLGKKKRHPVVATLTENYLVIGERNTNSYDYSTEITPMYHEANQHFSLDWLIKNHVKFGYLRLFGVMKIIKASFMPISVAVSVDIYPLPETPLPPRRIASW